MISRLRQADAAALLPMLVALIVLLPAIRWGLPHGLNANTTDPWGYDEIAPMGPLIEANGKFRIAPKPDAYLAYPLFHYIVLVAADAPYLGYQYATGQFRPDSQFPYGMADPVAMLAALTLIGRGVTVLMALACVWLVYRIAVLIGVERWLASAAATAVACLPTFAYYGHMSNLDIPYIVWTLAALHAAAAVIFDNRFGVGPFVRFGVFASLAVATKDQAYAFVIGIPPLLLLALARNVYHGSYRRALGHRPLWIGLIASLAAFALANNLVLGSQGFRRHIDQALEMSKNDRVWPSDMAGQMGLLRDCAEQLAITMGPLFALATFGIVRLARAREWTTLAFLTLPIVLHHVLVLARIGYCHPRFLLLPSMLLMILAACGAQIRPAGRPFALLLGGLAAIGFVWLIVLTLDITRAQFQDARYEAAVFLAEHVRRGETVETYARYERLMPRLPDGVNLNVIAPQGIGTKGLESRSPEFVVVTDLSEQALLHQPENRPFHDDLLAGKLGYHVVFDRQTPRLLARYLVRGLAPRVIVLERLEPVP